VTAGQVSRVKKAIVRGQWSDKVRERRHFCRDGAYSPKGQDFFPLDHENQDT
jgi:hypothetical protein